MKELIDNEVISIRLHTRRDRIKLRRAKRNNHRFYVYSSDGKVRARKTETRKCAKASSVNKF